VQVTLEDSFRKRLLKKTHSMQGSILECIKKLADDPRHPGLHTHRVQGSLGVFEAYVDDANRLTFHYENGTIVLRNHCNHSVVNRSP
jgi:mRNA-degrading endonuclease YafQ of YafQ-DinJ toxin-antitoxin module